MKGRTGVPQMLWTRQFREYYHDRTVYSWQPPSLWACMALPTVEKGAMTSLTMQWGKQRWCRRTTACYRCCGSGVRRWLR